MHGVVGFVSSLTGMSPYAVRFSLVFAAVVVFLSVALLCGIAVDSGYRMFARWVRRRWRTCAWRVERKLRAAESGSWDGWSMEQIEHVVEEFWVLDIEQK